MATKTTTKKRVVKKPEAMVNDAPRTFTDADFEVGTGAHQGDMIFLRLKRLPKSATHRESRQLAIGNTQGSRHVLKTGNCFNVPTRDFQAAVQAAVKQYKPSKRVTISEQLIGPVFSTCNGVAEVDHPEHGNHVFHGDMVIACIYQRNLDAEEREQRARD